MPRRANSFELALADRSDGIPKHVWLYRSLRDQFLEGRLRAGMRLPATRDLAGQYGLSRGTVVRVFEELASEGYLEGSTGSGTYVSRVLPDALLNADRARRTKSSPTKPRRRISDLGGRVRMFANFTNRPSRAFRPNLPAIDLFPADLWAQVATRRLRRASTNLLFVCDPMGYAPLRGAVADYLTTSRGVKCEADQVAIVAGVQEALDLAARLLINPGDRVGVEDPGYPGAANAFEAAGATIAPLDVDDEGIKLDERKLKGARLVYVTPGHQFPLGITMSLPRRLQLLEWARKSGAVIFEDDYDSEYRYSGRPAPALQGLDSHGNVLFAGSFSKVLFPSLRLGYMVVPPDLVDRVAAIISITSRHAPLLDQAILCDFIVEGHFGRHLRRMRQIYAERLSALLEGAKEKWEGLLEVKGIEAGLQVGAWLGHALRAEEVAKTAAAAKVEVIPLRWYGRRPMKNQGLQLGFAAVDVGEIKRGIGAMAAALEACARR